MVLLSKDMNILVCQHKANKVRQSWWSTLYWPTEGNRGNSVLWRNSGRANAVYRLYVSSFCFLFLGFNCHLFLWQCQYSMDQLTGKSSIFFIYMLYSRGTKKITCYVLLLLRLWLLAWDTKQTFPPTFAEIFLRLAA